MADEKLPITNHLEELRWRLIKCFIAIGVGFGITYSFSKQIFNFLISPLVKLMPPGSKLIYTSLPEAFVVDLKVAFFAGLVISMPIIFYQIWKFVEPGLYPNERKNVIPFVFAATFFFLAGASFAFFVVFPFGFKFFLSYSGGNVAALPSIKEYLSLCTSLLVAFGSIFELPVVIYFLARFGIVNHLMMRKYRKYVVLIIAIVAAILTPPDVVSQICMMIPLLILYEISIWIAKFVYKERVAKKAALETESSEDTQD